MTHKRVLSIGLLFLAFGIYMLNQGPQVLDPLAETFGLISRVPTESVKTPPILLNVAPSDSTFMFSDLKKGVLVRGSVQVGGGREIAFYVMTEGNFTNWRAHRPTALVLTKPFTTSSNFTFTPTVDGTYYFVFDNQENTRRSVVFSLSTMENVVVVDPIMRYSGYLISMFGVLFTGLGIRLGKRRKVEPQSPPPVTLWRCRYCGDKNAETETFCRKCGRSKT